MVRFAPPPLARLVTLALQARVHQDGLAPAAVGVAAPLLPSAPHEVTPMGHLGPATAYRASELGAIAPSRWAAEPKAGGVRHFVVFRVAAPQCARACNMCWTSRGSAEPPMGC